jgi:hypothetical protein
MISQIEDQGKSTMQKWIDKLCWPYIYIGIMLMVVGIIYARQTSTGFNAGMGGGIFLIVLGILLVLYRSRSINH